MENIRGRIRKLKLPRCRITPGELLELLREAENCPVCGVRYRWVYNKSKAYPDDGISVDRLHPDLGYPPKNIVLMCKRCNTLKSDGTPEELLRVAWWTWRMYYPDKPIPLG